MIRPLPGARELLSLLTEPKRPWAIATSGLAITARPSLDMLGLPPDTPLITRDQVRHAKPDPDLFLAAADLVGADVRNSFVIGDSTWDLLAARRAGTLGIGLLAAATAVTNSSARCLPCLRRPRRPARAPGRGRRSAQPGLDRHMNNIQITGAQE
jgi:beta-phosphoglucomutase-like phosphatase (HAD superfamily)